MPVESRTIQRRRRPAAVRKLLLAAAGRLFKEKGFTLATIEDIAAEAGVSKSVFYRHFRTKDALFGAAVLEPFTQFLEEFRPRYSSSFKGPWSEERLLELEKDLLRQIERHLRANREALERLAASDSGNNGPAATTLRRRFNSIFREMRSWGEAESEVWTMPPNLELTDRLIVCMISGLVMFDTWFMPAGRSKVGREELIDHMARLLLYGMRLGDEPRDATESRTDAATHN